jgi:glycerate 2-kinase
LKIANKGKILSHGSVLARNIAVDVAEHALASVDSYSTVKDITELSGDKLKVGSVTYDLDHVDNIYVVGAGKASLGMARALEDILGDRINEGIVVVKGKLHDLRRIEVIEAGHPIPDERGFEAAKRILELARNATERDLFLSVMTGGSSALISHPVDGISLDDEKRLTEMLLKTGATIHEINACRRHISATNGGRLAQEIQPAKLVNFIISDSVGDVAVTDPRLPRDFCGTPVCPDPTTFADAIRVLRRYGLWDEAPKSVTKYLSNATATMETPKDLSQMRVKNFVLCNLANLCDAAEKRAKDLGFNSMILTTMLEGESREAGIVLASIAKESESNGRPIEPPCVIVVGGETTVKVSGASGEGGPSQELALGFSLKIRGSQTTALLALDTDGTDGPTDWAGAVVDGSTVERAEHAGIDVFESLVQHDSSNVLMRLDDAIMTGTTDTNVCDLNLIVVSK